MPWMPFFFTKGISLSPEIRPTFLDILKQGYYLYSKLLTFQKSKSDYYKLLKILFPESIDLPKKYKKTKEIGGIISFLPEKDCFLIYKILYKQSSNSLNVEFSGFGNPREEELNKMKIISTQMIKNIEIYFNLKE